MPFAAAIPLIGAGISAAGNYLASRNQQQPQRVPFTGAVDPSRLLGEGMTGISGLFNTLSSRLAQGPSLPGAYAQDVPGLSGRDPRAPTTPNSQGLQWPGMDWAPAQAAQTSAAQASPAPQAGASASRGLPVQRNAMDRLLAQLPPELQDPVRSARLESRGGTSTYPTTGPIRLQFGGSDPRPSAAQASATRIAAPTGTGAASLTPQQQAAIQLLLGSR